MQEGNDQLFAGYLAEAVGENTHLQVPISLFSYKIRDWSRCRQISVGIFMAMDIYLFVVVLIPLLIFDVIFIAIVSFFCGTFIVYGD